MSDKIEDDITKLQRLQGEYEAGTHLNVATIYVKNLDDSVTGSDISNHFKSCGVISSMSILGGRQSKKYAILDFKDEKSAGFALLLNNSVLKGKKILVEKKKNNKKR